MLSTISLYKFLGWPDQVGVALFTLGLLLTLAPWLTGLNIAGFSVPGLQPRTKRTLRLVGPLWLIVAGAGFFPWIAATVSAQPAAPASAPTQPPSEAQPDAPSTESSLRQRCKSGDARACRELAEFYRDDFNAAKASLVDNPRDITADAAALAVSRVLEYLINRAEMLESIAYLRSKGLPHDQQKKQIQNLDRGAREMSRYQL